MTHIETMKLALEEMRRLARLANVDHSENAGVVALEQAIEQAEQAQPVAWRHNKTGMLYDTEKEVPLGDGDEWAEPLYTAPPPRQPQSEVDELIRNLGFDPEQFRTEAGFINHMKLRAAIQHPDEYNAAAQPMYKALANCVFCGRLNPVDGSDCKHDDTAPPPRQPLTSAEIMRMACKSGLDLEPPKKMSWVEVQGRHEQLLILARAIEAAHGIKENT
jgi:hypothetical protein